MSNPRIVVDTRVPGATALVTYVVPCFNAEREVKETLESIREAVSGCSIELIVIDDGSTDQTLTLLAGLHWPENCLVMTQANCGLSNVRNLGASLARGVWLAFLDSDDLITGAGFDAMRRLADNPGTDLILARTEIFGRSVGRHQPFYDWAFWEMILDRRRTAVFCKGQEPRLMALEPNMNYRWIRRSFYNATEIRFPEGLLFEDTPAHFLMLLRAREVALTSSIYYRYRVNRPGKITEEKSLRRFDVIPVIRLALDVLMQESSQPLEAAYGLRGLFRLSWGCGTMVPLARRYGFFRQVVCLYSGLPSEWKKNYQKVKSIDFAHQLLGLLMRRQMAEMLFLMSVWRDLTLRCTRFRFWRKSALTE